MSGSAAVTVTRRVRASGVEVEVHEVGDGPVVGYLHGILGTPAVLPFLTSLGRHYHVIAPNLPGFGGSEPLDVAAYHEWVWVLSELVDAAGLTGRPVVASSVGAMLASDLATLRPEAFAALVLVAPLGLWLDESPVHDLWAERTARQPEWLVADPDVLQPFSADADGASADERMDAEIRRYRTRRSAASIMWPIPERGLERRIHRLSCPTTVIWGSEDRLAAAEPYLARWASLLPGSTQHIVDGAGHLVEWDRPDAVADLVAAAGLR